VIAAQFCAQPGHVICASSAVWLNQPSRRIVVNRKIFAVIVALCTCQIAASARAASNVDAQISETGSIDLAVRPPTYRPILRSDGWHEIQASGCLSTGEPGQPLLPHQMLDIVLPPDVLAESLYIEVLNLATVVEPGTYTLPAAQAMRSMRDLTAIPITAPANPAKVLPVARIIWTGQMRRWKLARIDFAPFQYDAASGKITVVAQATVRIHFSRSGSMPSPALMSDTVMDGLVAAHAVNYGMASLWYTGSNLAAPSLLPQPAGGPAAASCPANDPWPYVIVTTNEIVAAHAVKLNAFVNHKELTRGQYVRIVTQNDYDSLTGEAPNGRAEKIRQWLINNYVNHGIHYVLMIGDPTPASSSVDSNNTNPNWPDLTTSVPMKWCLPLHNWPVAPTTSTTGGTQTPDPEPEAPTDYYYSNLSSNWNQDGDSAACTFRGDYADSNDNPLPPGTGLSLAPDVFVGRIPVYAVNDAALDRVLQKIIDYQSSNNILWRKSALFPMSFWAENQDGAILGEALWGNFLNSAGFSRWRIYQQGTYACSTPPSDNPNYTNNSTYQSDENLTGGNTILNRWALRHDGIVAWWAHGSLNSISAGWDTCWDPTNGGFIFSSGQADPSSTPSSLDDAHPAFTFENSCDNGLPESSGNLQHSILNWGGIATVAATRAVIFSSGDVTMTNVDQDSAAGIGYHYLQNLVVSGTSAGVSLADAKFFNGAQLEAQGLKQKLDLSLYGDPEVGIGDSAGSAPGPGGYCSGHGKCAGGACSCRGNFAPPDCSTCLAGYSGPDCAVTCPGGPTCSGNGTCNNGVCACNAAYAPPDCSVTCPGGPTCSGHGTCSAGTCKCNAGYSGADCSVTCPGGPTCSGNGTCNNGVCACNAAYAPPDCSVTCPGGPTCSGHGTCSAGACTCTAGYSGPSCSVNCGSNSACPDGNACTTNTQCGSRVCNGNVCKAPGCSPHCNQGASCGANGDCGSGVCTSGLCQPPACSSLCSQGAACGVNGDCASRVCTNNLCQAPGCSPHCNQGASCGVNGDCWSHVCTNGLCQRPDCSPKCSRGAFCANNSDCTSQVCNNGTCR
jgi:hypothetical protein